MNAYAMTWQADDAGRAAARQAERKNVAWMLVFGTCIKEFVCAGRVYVPVRAVLVACYPGALPSRMPAAETALTVKRNAMP